MYRREYRELYQVLDSTEKALRSQMTCDADVIPKLVLAVGMFGVVGNGSRCRRLRLTRSQTAANPVTLGVSNKQCTGRSLTFRRRFRDT